MPAVWLFSLFCHSSFVFSISSDSSLSIDQSIFTLSHSFEQCARMPARMLLHYNYEFDWMLCDLFVYHLSDWMCLFVVCFSIEPDSGFRFLFFNFYLCSALSILLNNHWIQIGTFGLAAPLYLFYPYLLYLTFFQTRSPCSCSFVFDRFTHTNSLRRSRCSISSLFYFSFVWVSFFPFLPITTYRYSFIIYSYNYYYVDRY